MANSGHDAEITGLLKFFSARYLEINLLPTLPVAEQAVILTLTEVLYNKYSK